jgi:hypothetical protein
MHSRGSIRLLYESVVDRGQYINFLKNFISQYVYQQLLVDGKIFAIQA